MKRVRKVAPDPVAAHRAGARTSAPAAQIRAAVVTASDSRHRADDVSGDLLADGLVGAGVQVVDRRLVGDDARALETAIRGGLALGADAVLVTGGTGASPRDVTPEVLRALGGRTLPGFGEAFRALSFAEVGTAAWLSRATAVVVDRAAVFALPGSPAACRLALTQLILPELSHLVAQLRRRD